MNCDVRQIQHGHSRISTYLSRLASLAMLSLYAQVTLDTRDFPCQYSDKENLWSRTPTSIMNSVIFFIFFSVFPLFKQDLRLGSLQRIIFVLIVISIDTYQNEIIFKDSRLKCHENINVQKNNIYFRYKHIYKNIYRYIDRYIIGKCLFFRIIK